MPNAPRVSVCIPARNCAAYIEAALRSVLDQDFTDFEIIVVDNASTDETDAIIQVIAQENQKIRVFRNATNIGLVGNFNRCLSLARGTYIKYLCADDILLPSCLSHMVSELESDSAISLVCGARLCMDREGKTFGLRQYSTQDATLTGYTAINRCLFGGNYIGEPTAVMFRKSDVSIGFREDLPQLMDMELWFRLLENGSLRSLKHPVCAIRFHDEQITLKNVRSGKLVQDNIRIFEEFSQKPYILHSEWLYFKHKMLMTYRIWSSRSSIEEKIRYKALKKFGLPLCYPLMPFIQFAKYAGKRILLKISVRNILKTRQNVDVRTE